jgi:hypothetical protein
MSAQQESVRLIRIFVSSPGYVAKERETLDEVIGAINDVQGRQYGVRLEAWKWEDQVVPQIGPPANIQLIYTIEQLVLPESTRHIQASNSYSCIS